MCCSAANIEPLIRDKREEFVMDSSGVGLPIYYANAFSHPEFPVVTNTEPDRVQYFSWGLIPSFCRSMTDADNLRRKTVNARSETVFEKASFAPSAKNRRCLVPVTGFYEWHDQDGKKYPYFITMPKAKDFALAGIWNKWRDPNSGKIIPTFCILTTAANPLIAKIHNLKERMPVILTPEEEKIWLDPLSPVKELQSLLRPYEGKLDAWPVRKITNFSGSQNNVPQVQAPFDYPELQPIQESCGE